MPRRLTRSFPALVAGILLVSAASADTHDPPQEGPRNVYVVRPAHDAIIIDGHVTPGEWRPAKPVAGFHAADRLVPNQTLIRLLYDYEALYLSAICYERHIGDLVAPECERDGDVLAADCIECFLDVNNDEETYLHMAVSAAGAQYDAKGRDASWNCEWEAAVSATDLAWSLEAKLPFTSLDAKTPALLDLWGFNIGRRRRAGLDEPEVTEWSNTLGDLHRPWLFGHLLFTQEPMPPGVSLFEGLTDRVGGPARVFADAGYVDVDSEPVVVSYAALLSRTLDHHKPTDATLQDLREFYGEHPDDETADRFWRISRKWDGLARSIKRARTINALTYAWGALDLEDVAAEIAQLSQRRAELEAVQETPAPPDQPEETDDQQ